MKAGSRRCELPPEEDKVKVTVSPAGAEEISVAAAAALLLLLFSDGNCTVFSYK